MVRTVSTGRPDCSTVFSVNAPVGHSFTQAPQDTQFDVTNPLLPPLQRARAGNRSRRERAADHGQRKCALNFTAGANTTRARNTDGIIERKKRVGFVMVINASGALPISNCSDVVCQRQSFECLRRLDSSACSERYNSMMLRRCRFSRSLSVDTIIPSRTGVVQDAGVPDCPFTSQRHKRQEPYGVR